MNNEIKEILDNFKIYEDRYKKFNETQFIIFYRDIHLLLNYITNLEEDNSHYQEVLDCEENFNIYLNQSFKELERRINKAIEYIEDNVAVCAFGNKELPHWEFDDNNIQDLLNILKGENND